MTICLKPIATLMVCLTSLAGGSGFAQTVLRGAERTPAVFFDHLPSLRGAMAQTEGIGAEHRVRELKHIPLIDAPGQASDPVVQAQATTSAAAATAAGRNFPGIGKGDYGFTVNYAPPDTTGAVGETQYMQWVNVSWAIFNKTDGSLAAGPSAGNILWSGFGGACQSSNDGDPIVTYDKLAGRWMVSQFAVPGGSAGNWQCVAVSATSDATGAWYRYAFSQPAFNDYPKVGVWPDGYYVTYNMFGSTFQGARVCAMDRAKMLLGQAATQQCFQLSSSYASLLPADFDGTVNNPPPAGAPNYLVNRLSTSLGFWKFHVDWTTATNSTLTGPSSIPVSAYKAACGGGACVPQPGTSQKLDSLADRLMYRLAYRNLLNSDGTTRTETMVVNHSVQVNTTSKRNSGNAAIRWYEIRGMSGSGTPSLYQQATYSPDTTTFRWMGSIAMDKLGNIALGYSASSSTAKPSIRYATRAKTDATNTLSNDTLIIQGLGSQTSSLSRWGDYTQMSVDPVDDCTFWYTGQYLNENGSFNWKTQIASFKISGCQ